MLHIYRRENGKYYYRRRVPSECRSAINKPEIHFSLKTNDKQSALRKYMSVNSHYEQLFLEIKERAMRDKIQGFEVVRTVNKNGETTETRRVDPAALQAMKDAGMTAEEIAKMGEHIFAEANTIAPAQHTASTPSNTGTTSITLKELVTEYQKHISEGHTKNWKPDSGVITKQRRLMEILGETTSIQKISRDDARKVKETLVKLPKDSGKPTLMSVDQRIRLAEDASSDYETISKEQVNDHLSMYDSIFSYAMKEDYFNGKNPFEGLRLKITKKQSKRDARDNFQKHELCSIFQHEIFTNYQVAKNKTGKLYPYRFWTPLIALYSGARPSEIGGLNVNDIVKKDGIWCFDFNENGKGKSVKTYNSERLTPIHPALIDLGFIDFVKQVKKIGRKVGDNKKYENDPYKDEIKLFPDLPYEEKPDSYGRYIGEHFNNKVLKHKDINLYVKIVKVFYSFRHTFTTELQRIGVSEETREHLCGRDTSSNSTGNKVYLKRDTVPNLYRHLSRLDFSEELADVHKFDTKWI